MLVLCTACNQEKVLDHYNNFIETVGELPLTNNSKLKGTRKFGDDHYTGIYQVDYKEFSGTEVLFGGTSVEDVATIHISIDLDDSKGDIKIIMRLKDKDEVLATEDGNYEFDFNIEYGSNYLIVESSKYSGKLNLEIN